MAPLKYSYDKKVILRDYFGNQRARAATAIWRRFFAESTFALAFPPFKPTLRRARVAGESDSFGESFGTSPVVMSRMSLASWFGSRGRFGS
jgi:hypothetical protein